MAEALGTVHTRGWGLLRGWWWTVGLKLVFYKLAAPVPKIMDVYGNLVADILLLCLCGTRHQISHK
jgi:hypothetical protein